MQIELSKKQYKELLRLVYLGDWVVNAHKTTEKDEFRETAEHIYSYYKDFDINGWFEYVSDENKYYPTSNFDEEMNKYIEKYRADEIEEELAMMMTASSIQKRYPLSKVDKLTDEEMMEIFIDMLLKKKSQVNKMTKKKKK